MYQTPHIQQNAPIQLPPHKQPQQQPAPKKTVTVVGIPSVTIQDNRLVVGSSQSVSTRSYTPLKVLGDGSFGTVWLCDWHGTLPPNTPLSPMQRGAGARPEWAGKRLVAVKRMKKKWEGGWDECKKLKELESLRAIPFHPNVIPLYDFFLIPSDKELYFVFESMEGNLYHLIKARKGRALAGGLVSSIFLQIVSGLDHIHSYGYFHRDMKPENVLVTTTGLYDYTSVSPFAPPNAPKEKDVVAIIKLADFGLARETKSKPPYTEYVSTRWYRAPEVLLLSRDYSNPVDMWALGTIMAELVNLRPLFPGSDQVDQVARICEVLGDPSDAYGFDASGSVIGGGPWPKGNRLAAAVGFQFAKSQPKDFHALFDRNVPRSLVNCIQDLLRYDPDKRLTSRQCLEHPYLMETIPRNDAPYGLQPSVSQTSIPQMPSHLNGSHSQLSSPNRVLPPSHSHSAHNHPPHHFPNAASTHRVPFPPPPPQPSNVYATHDDRHLHTQWQEPQAQGDYIMADHSHRPPNEPSIDANDTSMIQDLPRPGDSQIPNGNPPATNSTKPGKFSFGRKPPKWALMFGGEKAQQNALPPVDETSPAVVYPSTRKRTQSLNSNRSMRDSSPVREAQAPNLRDIKKQNKKEAERLHLEAEKEKHRLREQSQKEMSRAVMQKRRQLQRRAAGDEIEWRGGNEQRMDLVEKNKQPASGPVRKNDQRDNATSHVISPTINAASGKFIPQAEPLLVPPDREWRGPERISKARRREYDDDHSMSSSDVHSISRMSSISFATVDSDPGPPRIRNRPSLFGISRVTSRSSLRTSFDDFSPSARSSNSFSLEGQLAHDFRTQASLSSHISGSVSPPPLQYLSLSPNLSPSSPSPPWMHLPTQHEKDFINRTQSPPYMSLSPHYPSLSNSPHSPLDMNGHLPPSSPYGHPPSSYGCPSSSGNTPKSSKSAINPIFKVPLPPPPLPPLPNTNGDHLIQPSTNTLPPFSHLEAVAGGGELLPIAPMAITTTSAAS